MARIELAAERRRCQNRSRPASRASYRLRFDGIAEDKRHRAPGVPRARARPRCRPTRWSAGPAGRPQARRPDARSRLSQGQGPAAGRDPPAGPRGRARRGAAQLARRVVRRRHRRRRDRARSASPTSTSATCPARASRWRSRSRSACGREAKLGEYKGLEVGRREPAVDGRGDRRRGRAAARPAGHAGHRRAPRPRPATTSSSTTSARSTASRFAGGEGRDQLIELGSGRLIPGFEEQLVGAVRRRRARRSRSPSPRTIPAISAARTPPSTSRSRRSRPSACPSSTTTSPPRRRSSTRWPSCARTSPAGCARPTSTRSSASSRRRCCEAAADEAEVELPDKLIHARAHELLEQTLLGAGPPGDQQGDLPADRRQGRGGARPRRRARRRRRAAPRGGAGRDRRGRADRAHRRGAGGGAAPGGRARRLGPRRAASSSCARPAAWISCARTWPAARRSSCWCARRRRSASSRPRRARSCGPPARRIRERVRPALDAGKLTVAPDRTRPDSEPAAARPAGCYSRQDSGAGREKKRGR